MLNPPFRARLACLPPMAAIASFLMLSACASSGKVPPAPPGPEADPVVEVRYETRTVCPAELRQPLPTRPPVPAGAVVEANAEGAAWLAEDLDVAASVRRLFEDAASACPVEEAGPTHE